MSSAAEQAQQQDGLDGISGMHDAASYFVANSGTSFVNASPC